MTDTAQLRALLAKMTQGEWALYPHTKDEYFDVHDAEGWTVAEWLGGDNAAGIVAFVNAAEPMLDELERLRAEVARLRAGLRVGAGGRDAG